MGEAARWRKKKTAMPIFYHKGVSPISVTGVGVVQPNTSFTFPTTPPEVTNNPSLFVQEYTEQWILEKLNLVPASDRGALGEVMCSNFTGESTPVLIFWNGSAWVKVDQAGGGWGGTWGSITGTLSSQTDLQNALNGKAAKPAATSPAYAATITPARTAEKTILNVGTLTGNLTLAAPTGTPTDGDTLTIRISLDGTGGETITFNAAYAFGTDVTTAMVPTSANAKFELLFQWHAGDSKWRCVGIVRGF